MLAKKRGVLLGICLLNWNARTFITEYKYDLGRS